MKLKNENLWKEGLENNKDSEYGACGYRYIERWANLMEVQMNEGRALEDIASSTSHEADTEGITGFMYGMSVSMLFLVWKYGEELRRWHNLDVQLGAEGVRANKDGGVLNPALLSIGKMT